jgi:hypothetical protein
VHIDGYSQLVAGQHNWTGPRGPRSESERKKRKMKHEDSGNDG